MEADERDAAAEAERREVERRRRRTLPTDDRERDGRADQLGDEELVRRDEKEAENERELAERQAVRLAAEVDVNGERLGDEEDDDEAPPRDLEGGRRRLRGM